MIDMHNHSLFGVDDGPNKLEESVLMIESAVEQGIDTIILTPHYRHGMFPYDRAEIFAHLAQLKKAVKHLPIHLYLGCEYHVNSKIVTAFTTHRCETMAGGDYVLAEYAYDTEYSYILETVKELLSSGYLPVIAHVERYRCLLTEPERCEELRQIGAMVQMNADTVLGNSGRKMKHFARVLMKNGWVDLIASDAHGIELRKNCLGECRAFVAKKYGEIYADLLFEKNPGKLLFRAVEVEELV